MAEPYESAEVYNNGLRRAVITRVDSSAQVSIDEFEQWTMEEDENGALVVSTTELEPEVPLQTVLRSLTYTGNQNDELNVVGEFNTGVPIGIVDIESSGLNIQQPATGVMLCLSAKTTNSGARTFFEYTPDSSQAGDRGYVLYMDNLQEADSIGMGIVKEGVIAGSGQNDAIARDLLPIDDNNVIIQRTQDGTGGQVRFMEHYSSDDNGATWTLAQTIIPSTMTTTSVQLANASSGNSFMIRDGQDWQMFIPVDGLYNPTTPTHTGSVNPDFISEIYFHTSYEYLVVADGGTTLQKVGLDGTTSTITGLITSEIANTYVGPGGLLYHSNFDGPTAVYETCDPNTIQNGEQWAQAFTWAETTSTNFLSVFIPINDNGLYYAINQNNDGTPSYTQIQLQVEDGVATTIVNDPMPPIPDSAANPDVYSNALASGFIMYGQTAIQLYGANSPLSTTNLVYDSSGGGGDDDDSIWTSVGAIIIYSVVGALLVTLLLLAPGIYKATHTNAGWWDVYKTKS